VALKNCELDLLHKLWEWPKKVITPEDFNNMFVVKDREKRTAWHISARKGQK